MLSTQIAWKHYNVPYIWGGQSPLVGFDCSGFVMDILIATGIVPKGTDMTAHGLWDHFKPYRTHEPKEGCFVFYGKPDKITHVMYCIGGGKCIGAQGGGSKCTGIEVAQALDARVKCLPINYRPDIVGYCEIYC